MYLLKADRLVSTASRGAIHIRLDDRAVGSVLLETAEYLQQEDAPKAMLMKTRMDAEWLDLSDVALGNKPAHTETSE
jgi:hypothetical protein